MKRNADIGLYTNPSSLILHAMLEFVNIPPGIFIMGSPEDEAGRDDDEHQQEITLPMDSICRPPR